MDMVTIVVIAIGLAMDAFAVSITSVLTMKYHKIHYAFRIALFFGVWSVAKGTPPLSMIPNLVLAIIFLTMWMID